MNTTNDLAMRKIADLSGRLLRAEQEAKAQHEIVHRSSNIIRELEQQRDELLAQLNIAYVDLTLLHIGDSGEWKNSCKAERMRNAIAAAKLERN